jgi:hypothetical protein
MEITISLIILGRRTATKCSEIKPYGRYGIDALRGTIADPVL